MAAPSSSPPELLKRSITERHPQSSVSSPQAHEMILEPDLTVPVPTAEGPHGCSLGCHLPPFCLKSQLRGCLCSQGESSQLPVCSLSPPSRLHFISTRFHSSSGKLTFLLILPHSVTLVSRLTGFVPLRPRTVTSSFSAFSLIAGVLVRFINRLCFHYKNGWVRQTVGPPHNKETSCQVV